MHRLAVEARAASPEDTVTRFWYIGPVKPTTTWWVLGDDDSENESEVLKRGKIEPHESGDQMRATLQLPDGKHTIYFGVGFQSDEASMLYDGELIIGGQVCTFNNIDGDTLAACDVEIKGGKLYVEGSSEDEEIGSTGSKFDFGSMLKFGKIKEIAEQKKREIVIGVSVPVAAGGLLLAIRKWRKGRTGARRGEY
jgi:hypothetical protein